MQNVVTEHGQDRPAADPAGLHSVDRVEQAPFKCCRNVKLMAWNPCSIATDARRLEVSHAFKCVDVGALIGTRVRCPDPKCRHTVQKSRNHTYIHFGWFQGVFTNHSTGVSVMLGKRIATKCIQRISFPGQDLAGRGGAVRVSQGPLRINIIAAYFPPPPRSTSEKKGWHLTCRKLLQWIQNEVKDTPTRCTPMIFTDMNSGFVKTEEHDEEVIGPYWYGNETATGLQIKEWMHNAQFTALDTWYRVGPTFWGVNGRTHPDHVLIPQAMVRHVKKMEIWHATARSVRFKPKFVDHLPIVFTMDVVPPNCNTPRRSQRWINTNFPSASRTAGVGRIS